MEKEPPCIVTGDLACESLLCRETTVLNRIKKKKSRNSVLYMLLLVTTVEST
jgi:hypothetical protein